MKKKILIALFVMALVVCVFASCGKCKHEEYAVKETVPATCVAEGKTIFACAKCGEEKVESIAKLTTHKLEYEEVKPTCSTDGTITETCKVEGCTYKNVKKGDPATGICKPAEVVTTPATCTEDGVKAYLCTVCGAPVYQPGFVSTIPALGHTYDRSGLLTDEEKGISFVAGSCAGEGYFARECKDCGYNKDPITRDEYAQIPGYDVNKYDEMEAWEHAFTQFVENVGATCEEEGYTLYKCEFCDETDRQNPMGALGHTYNKTENAVEDVDYVISPKPTCINPGVKAYICKTCGEAAKNDADRESVGVIPHDFPEIDEELITQFEADCLNPAKKIFGCCVDPLCTEFKEYEYGEPLGHDEQRGEVTCATKGLTPYSCSRCDFYEEREDEFSMDKPHTFGKMLTAATCITDATYECSVCSNTYGPYADDAQYADGFAHGNHVFDAENPQVIPPECDKEGYNVYCCIADESCVATRKDYENTDMTKPDTPRAEDIVARLTHEFGVVTEDGRIICKNCPLQYRDVSTEITNGGGNLCLGTCEGTECTCGLTVEWNGYVSPDAPEAIVAGEVFDKKEVEWDSLEEVKALAMGEGVIIIIGEAGAKYTVELFATVDGESVGELVITAEGEAVVIDLYRYENVEQIKITSTADAVVSFYSLIKPSVDSVTE